MTVIYARKDELNMFVLVPEEQRRRPACYSCLT